ncbi:MAG: hypothetical protein WCI94_18515 [Rhodospirillales bacterium]
MSNTLGFGGSAGITCSAAETGGNGAATAGTGSVFAIVGATGATTGTATDRVGTAAAGTGSAAPIGLASFAFGRGACDPKGSAVELTGPSREGTAGIGTI